MFQASYLNGIEFKCFDHPKNNVTHVCTDYKCYDSPFVCSECLNSSIGKQRHFGHELQVRQLMQTVNELSSSLYRYRKPIESIFKKISSQKQNESLLKYQEQKEQHCHSIRKHIQSIKYEVEDQVKNILKVFEKQILKEKENMFLQLERYYESYKEKFQHFSRKMGPIAAISKSYKYYASKHNILLKLLSDSEPSTLNRWFIQLKRSVKAAQILSAQPQAEYEKVRKLCLSTNEMMDQLPRIRNAQYENDLPQLMNNIAKDVFKLMIKFGEPKYSLPRSASMSNDPSKFRSRS